LRDYEVYVFTIKKPLYTTAQEKQIHH